MTDSIATDKIPTDSIPMDRVPMGRIPMNRMAAVGSCCFLGTGSKAGYIRNHQEM